MPTKRAGRHLRQPPAEPQTAPPLTILRGLLPDLAASPAEVALSCPGTHAAAMFLAPPALPVTDLAEALASALRAQPPAGMRLEQPLRMRPPLSFWALVHEVVIPHRSRLPQPTRERLPSPDITLWG